MCRHRLILAMFMAGWVASLGFPAFCDSVSVSCNSPFLSIPGGGGTTTAHVNCGINTSGGGNDSFYISGSSSNFMSPASLTLQSSSSTLTAIRQASVLSPDNTVTAIAGTAAGFTGTLGNNDNQRLLQFQYAITTTPQTPPGLYTSIVSPSYYQYHICRNQSCDQVMTGTASVILVATVQSTPMSVSCTSPAVNATPGGGGDFRWMLHVPSPVPAPVEFRHLRRICFHRPLLH